MWLRMRSCGQEKRPYLGAPWHPGSQLPKARSPWNSPALCGLGGPAVGNGVACHILRPPVANDEDPWWGGPKAQDQEPLLPRPTALSTDSARGYLYLLEVHRLADELVVLRQLLAGRQLDEHLTELASTAAVRRDVAASLAGRACRGAPTSARHPPPNNHPAALGAGGQRR